MERVRLLEEEIASEHMRQAVTLAECVGICRAYQSERVVTLNIRRILLGNYRPTDDEVDLFAMLLMRHVRDPHNAELYNSAKAVWERIKTKRL